MDNGMNKGLTLKAGMAAAMALACTLYCVFAVAEVYKVVDAEGNVTYTDQAPADGAAPMKLPELSIIDTDYQEKAPQSDVSAGTADPAVPAALTPRELRKLYKDFHITRPLAEETFWGTANTVVVSWGSSAALKPGMQVRVFVDGTAQEGAQDGMLALTLDRGEHTVYADLLDDKGRKVVSTEKVTFYIKQESVGANAPRPTPRHGT